MYAVCSCLLITSRIIADQHDVKSQIAERCQNVCQIQQQVYDTKISPKGRDQSRRTETKYMCVRNLWTSLRLILTNFKVYFTTNEREDVGNFGINRTISSSYLSYFLDSDKNRNQKIIENKSNCFTITTATAAKTKATDPGNIVFGT